MVTEIKVKAVRLVDGVETPLENITGLTLRSTLDSPAVILEISAAVSAIMPQLGKVYVYRAGKKIFEGLVDKQQSDISAQGRLLKIEARSKGALLLDNEALPRLLLNANLATVFSICASPYGFVLGARSGFDRRLAQYTIQKGQSQWEVLCGFCRRVFSVTPYVQGDVINVQQPATGSMARIGGSDRPVSHLRQIHEPYQIVSKVVLRDEAGLYSGAVHNSAAKYYGVQRTRYIIPTSEFVDSPALDANQRIRRSMLHSSTVEATLPGYHDIEVGQPVEIETEMDSLRGLMVTEKLHSLDSSGISTWLKLVRSEYN